MFIGERRETEIFGETQPIVTQTGHQQERFDRLKLIIAIETPAAEVVVHGLGIGGEQKWENERRVRVDVARFEGTALVTSAHDESLRFALPNLLRFDREQFCPAAIVLRDRDG